MIQETTHVSTAVNPSAFGAFAVTELKMFTSTKNNVTRSAILPEVEKMKGVEIRLVSAFMLEFLDLT